MIKTKTSIIKIGGTRYIRIPREIIFDSKYPFNKENKFIIQIIKNVLVIRR